MNLLNWMRDKTDHRDHLYHDKFEVTPSDQLPDVVDLRPHFPVCYNQGSLGSCTAHALVAALQYQHIKDNQDAAMLSRLFVYYNERLVEGTQDVDRGAYLRDGIKALASQGICHEDEWPYLEEAFKTKPNDTCYLHATSNRISDYTRIVDFDSMLHCLASGFPFVFGFMTYPDLQSEYVAQTGILPMPDTTEPSMGGHAVCAVGYDKTKNVFIIRNSWGPSWGQNGYFTMPFDYLRRPDLASDFWMIRK